MPILGGSYLCDYSFWCIIIGKRCRNAKTVHRKNAPHKKMFNKIPLTPQFYTFFHHPIYQEVYVILPYPQNKDADPNPKFVKCAGRDDCITNMFENCAN